MAQKSTRIDDVKRPEKVTPSATSRPILVSGQASAPTDPMMVPAAGDKPEAETVQVMSHTARTITPPSEPDAEKTEEKPEQSADAEGSTKSEDEAASPAAGEAPAKPKDEKPAESKPDVVAVSEPAEKASEAEDTGSESPDRDPDAAISAEEAAAAEAQAKRDEELEGLITSGKYAVPIDAVQRRRTRMHTLLLSLFALLLVVALLDLVADVGILDLPSGVPHTHLFSGR